MKKSLSEKDEESTEENEKDCKDSLVSCQTHLHKCHKIPVLQLITELPRKDDHELLMEELNKYLKEEEMKEYYERRKSTMEGTSSAVVKWRWSVDDLEDSDPVLQKARDLTGVPIETQTRRRKDAANRMTSDQITQVLARVTPPARKYFRPHGNSENFPENFDEPYVENSLDEPRPSTSGVATKKKQEQELKTQQSPRKSDAMMESSQGEDEEQNGPTYDDASSQDISNNQVSAVPIQFPGTIKRKFTKGSVGDKVTIVKHTSGIKNTKKVSFFENSKSRKASEENSFSLKDPAFHPSIEERKPDTLGNSKRPIGKKVSFLDQPEGTTTENEEKEPYLQMSESLREDLDEIEYGTLNQTEDTGQPKIPKRKPSVTKLVYGMMRTGHPFSATGRKLSFSKLLHGTQKKDHGILLEEISCASKTLYNASSNEKSSETIEKEPADIKHSQELNSGIDEPVKKVSLDRLVGRKEEKELKSRKNSYNLDKRRKSSKEDQGQVEMRKIE